MRILVVEDEHKIANSVKKGLEQENYAVDVAYTGSDGYDMAAGESYDCILLDIMLPGIDGVEIAKKLRHEGNHTPIIMLTARDQVPDKVAGLDSGADDYLTKPFSFEELLARLRAVLRRPQDDLGTELSVEDLSLNTKTFEVRRGEVAIRLSSKEYSLLEYLLRHANTTIPKEQIISHVWDYEADILPNTVEVYIGYLRSKIDKPFPERPALIHTVRGFGYRVGKSV